MFNLIDVIDWITHAKLIELLLIPEDRVCDSQFGFRKGRGTSQACSFVNDLSKCCNDKGSPLHICTLDAEKCFDKIWHSGLFLQIKARLTCCSLDSNLPLVH